jgi:putative ABC transport system permease protein
MQRLRRKAVAMSFAALVLKNLLRQRVRTTLTVLGISLGITTVVALGVVTNSLRSAFGEILGLGGADFMVAQEGAADLTFSTISEDDVDALNRRDDVARAEGILFHIARLGSNPLSFMMGRAAEDLAENPPPLVAGAVFPPGATDQLLLGSRSADDLGLRVGDSVEVEDRIFRIVGIFQTGGLLEDAGSIAPLPVVQEIAAKTGVVTAVFVKAAEGSDPDDVARRIRDDFPNLVTISNVDEYSQVDQGVQFLDAANLGISILAVGIGAIGVMNTMIMSVFERTREIGILRAVGWSGSRILRMIIGESLLLCVIATVVGAGLGVLATRAILLIDLIRNVLEPEYTLDVFIRAAVVAAIVALLGAAYPAFRAVRQSPMDALRYE